jgi:hypothetical protein
VPRTSIRRTLRQSLHISKGTALDTISLQRD